MKCVISNILLASLILSQSCSKTDLGPGNNVYFEGEYYYHKRDNIGERKMDLRITGMSNNRVNLKLTGFPGPFYKDSTMNLDDIELNFVNVEVNNEFVFEFEQTQNAYNKGKIIYNAWFKVNAIKAGKDITLNIDIERKDIPGLRINYNYPFVKKI